MQPPLRLAIWSGPRNVSTALMRSFGSRADTIVCDEPLYAHYLQQTGQDHPMAAEIMERHETDWRKVADWLTGPLPEDKTVFYQKHMAHHLLPDIKRGWLEDLTHAFLIREPAAMLASLAQVLPAPRLEDTGLPQQVALFDAVRAATGTTPPVLDSRDVLADPEGVLRKLCAAVGLSFDPAMLSWEPGPRDTDGCWAPHWYASVEQSTGFLPPRESTTTLPDALAGLCASARPLYEHLASFRLTS